MTMQTLSALLILMILAVACGEKTASTPGGNESAQPGAAESESPKIYAQAPPVEMLAPVQTGEVSGTLQVGEWTLGPELAPAESAVSDTILEAYHKGDYMGVEGTTVTLVLTSEEPGQKAAGDYALKMTPAAVGVSGVTSDGSQIQFKAGHRYLVRCRVYGGDQASYRMGVTEAGGSVLWAKTPDAEEAFAAPASTWTELTGLLDMTSDQNDRLSSLRIVRQGETMDVWYLDGVSVAGIIE